MYLVCLTTEQSNQPPQVSSFGPFLLTGNSLNEIGLYIKPKTAGTRDVILNIVDTESRSLLSSWLVVCHANAPQITKSFDIGCKRGKLCNKVGDLYFIRNML